MFEQGPRFASLFFPSKVIRHDQDHIHISRFRLCRDITPKNHQPAKHTGRPSELVNPDERGGRRFSCSTAVPKTLNHFTPFGLKHLRREVTLVVELRQCHRLDPFAWMQTLKQLY